VKPGTIYVDFDVDAKHHEPSAAVLDAFKHSGYSAEEIPPTAGVPEWLSLATIMSFFGGVGLSVTVRLGERVADKALDGIADIAVTRLRKWLKGGEHKKATVFIYGPDGEQLRRVKVKRKR
jgi:hypothetical protein